MACTKRGRQRYQRETRRRPPPGSLSRDETAFRLTPRVLGGVTTHGRRRIYSRSIDLPSVRFRTDRASRDPKEAPTDCRGQVCFRYRAPTSRGPVEAGRIEAQIICACLAKRMSNFESARATPPAVAPSPDPRRSPRRSARPTAQGRAPAAAFRAWGRPPGRASTASRTMRKLNNSAV